MFLFDTRDVISLRDIPMICAAVLDDGQSASFQRPPWRRASCRAIVETYSDRGYFRFVRRVECVWWRRAASRCAWRVAKPVTWPYSWPSSRRPAAVRRSPAGNAWPTTFRSRWDDLQTGTKYDSRVKTKSSENQLPYEFMSVCCSGLQTLARGPNLARGAFSSAPRDHVNKNKLAQMSFFTLTRWTTVKSVKVQTLISYFCSLDLFTGV